MGTLLEVKDLEVDFYTDKGVVRAVDNVSFHVDYGETLGIVGESGCGKSVTSLSIIRLIPDPPGKISNGEIFLEGNDLLKLEERAMRSVRGKDISMIFQEPMTALNPVLTIGTQIKDVLRQHEGLTGAALVKEAINLLEQVGIPVPEKRINEYPHQMSGGMRQRVMIAMALSCKPKVMLADEPTTALDVTIQAQVLQKINDLQKKYQMAVILVTHDLGVIAETCQRVMVMYCGQIVEKTDVKSLFSYPRHPYSQGLLASIPRIREKKIQTLPIIEGTVPDLLNLPRGCRFGDRCPRAKAPCHQTKPTLKKVAEGVEVACFYPHERD